MWNLQIKSNTRVYVTAIMDKMWHISINYKLDEKYGNLFIDKKLIKVLA